MTNARWLSNRLPLGLVVTMTGLAVSLASCSDLDISTTENLPFTNVQEIPPDELAAAPTYRPSLKFQVGRAIENNEEREFRVIRDLAIDSTGNIYVKDRLVKVYRPDGSFSHRVGENGEGPASVKDASQIAVTGDTLVAVSSTHLKFFRTNGELLFQKRRPRSVALAVGASRKGIYIVDLKGSPHGSPPIYNDTLRLLATTTAPSDPVVIRSRNVFVRKWVSFVGRGGDAAHSAVTRAAGPPLLGVMPRGTVAYDGSILFPDPDSFAIHVRNPQGAPARTIVARIPPVETTRRDREDYSDFWDAVNAKSKTLGTPAGRELEGPRKRFRPFLGGWTLERITSSSSGHVIVQRFDISKRPYNRYAPDATSEWIIFSPEWQVIGRFSLPAIIDVKLFEGCMIYGMQPGEFDEQTLVAYKLTPTSFDGRVPALPCTPYQG